MGQGVSKGWENCCNSRSRRNEWVDQQIPDRFGHSKPTLAKSNNVEDVDDPMKEDSSRPDVTDEEPLRKPQSTQNTEDGVSTQAGEDGCSEVDSVSQAPASTMMLPNFEEKGLCQGFLERKALGKMFAKWSLQYVMIQDGQLARFDAQPGVKLQVKTVDLTTPGITFDMHWKVFVLKGTVGGEEDAEYRICSCSKPLSHEAWHRALQTQQQRQGESTTKPSSAPEFPLNRTFRDGKECQGLLERNSMSNKVFDSWQLQFVTIRDGKLTRFDVGSGIALKMNTLDLTVPTISTEIWNKAFIIRGTSKGDEDATFRICGCSQPLNSHHFVKALQAQQSKA